MPGDETSGEKPDYLRTALDNLAGVDQDDPAAYEAAVRRELGPFIRQVGRDLAALHLEGFSGEGAVSRLKDRLETELTGVEGTAVPLRGTLFAIIEMAGGYLATDGSMPPTQFGSAPPS